MLPLILLFLLYLQITAKEDEFFGQKVRKFLSQHINHSIDPCHNFYSHVCPVNIRKDQMLLFNAFSEEFLDYLDKVIPPSELEKDIQDPFITGLRRHPLILDYINQYFPIDKAFGGPLREKLSEFTMMIGEQVKKSFPYQSKKTVNLLSHRIFSANYFTGWTNMDYQSLKNLYKNLSDDYSDMKKISGKESAKQYFGRILGYFSNFDYPLFLNLKAATIDNSQYLNKTNTPEVFNSFILMSIADDIAIQHGITLFWAGHELHHSIFLEIELNETFSKDSRILNHRYCLSSHMANVSHIYRNEVQDPYPDFSNNETYNDDAPDLEGLQSAYRFLIETLDEKELQAIPYEELKLTREKLFFYGYAAGLCSMHDMQLYDGIHSANYARVNGPLSLTKAFIHTFQCGPETRMGRLYHDAPEGKCNQFGDPIKK